jgi:hypothetical protein
MIDEDTGETKPKLHVMLDEVTSKTGCIVEYSSAKYGAK